MDKALTHLEFEWLVKRRRLRYESDIPVMTNPLDDQERYELNVHRYRRAVSAKDDEPVSKIADAIIIELNRKGESSIGDIYLYKFNEDNVKLLSELHTK